MKNMINYKYMFLLLLGVSANGWSNLVQDEELSKDVAAGIEMFFSDDSEEFKTYKFSAEFFPQYINADHYMGMRASTYKYEAQDWNTEGQKISFLAKNIDTATANGWSIEAGIFEQNNHNLFTLDGSYRAQLRDKTALETFLNRDWVETPTALDEGIHFTFAGVAMDQGVGEHITAVGVVGSQFFSDNNRRDHGRIKLIYQPSLDLGLTLQARYRTYHSTKTDVDGRYFNPENYQEGMLAVGWRQRFNGWSTGFTAGYGLEKVNNTANQSTQLFELNLQSPIHNSQFIRINAGYNHSASFYGADYDYSYLRGEWILRF